MSPINYDSFKSIYDLVFALSFLIISYLQVLLSKFIKSNHYCFSIYSFHVFYYVIKIFKQKNRLIGFLKAQ